MTKVNKIKTNETIDISKYHNSETGELLSSELKPGTSMEIKSGSNMVTITSDDYAVIDTKAVILLSEILNNSDLANVLKMAVCSKTPLNIIYNHTIPHTHDTLQKHLAVSSKSMFIKLIRRLIKAGILYQIKGLIYGEVRVIYMINPFLSRKRKTFEDTVFEVFSEFKELAE